MLGTFVRKIFGSKNDREVKRMLKAVDAINRQESSLESLSDEALAAKRDEFRERIASGETLNQVLPDAFAVCREVRTMPTVDEPGRSSVVPTGSCNAVLLKNLNDPVIDVPSTVRSVALSSTVIV